MIRVAVIGASGRMGQAVINELASATDAKLIAAIVSSNSKVLGQQVDSSLRYSDGSELTPEAVDVLIDFSLPAALADNLQLAQRLQAAAVVCTTGLTSEQQQLLDQAAATVPVLYAANTSVGVCLLEQLVTLTSACLPNADIEILEAHHAAKRDGPSGTALLLGEAAAKGRLQQLAEVSAGVRTNGLRHQGSIGFAVLRAADIIGEHTVYAAQPGERVELSHRVSDRRVFARGALHAAQWLRGQAAGRYRLADTLQMEQHLRQLLNEI